MAKRIVVLLDTFDLLHATTGIRTYMIEMIRAFELHGDSECMDFRFSLDPDTAGNSRLFRGDKGLFRRILYHLTYLIWKEVILPIKALILQADVLICPDYVAPLWKLPLLKIPVVHSPFFWQHPENYSERWRRYYIKLVEWGFRGRSYGLTTSDYTQQALSGYVDYSGRLAVVYQSFPTMDAGVDAPIPFSDLSNAGYFLHIGYFDKRKNLETLVKAYAICRKRNPDMPVKLVLAGAKGSSREGDALPQIRQFISVNELEEFVLLPGYISDEERIGLYSNALAYVFPSFNEGFGIPLLEAMSAGLPVISSGSASLPEIGGDAALYFDTFDEEDLASKMELLINDQNLRKELIKRGEERIKEFSRKKFYGSVMDVIGRYGTD